MRFSRTASVSSFGVFAALVALFVPLLPPALALAATETLTPRFSIERGRAWTNDRRVTMGDRGWSPFFAPGVVVWDGGSILGGFRVPPELKFSTQTLRLVPRRVSSFMSWEESPSLEEMTAAAPAEVDAHWREHADANICVVMGGNRELSGRMDPARIQEKLAAYCLGRRAAGFQVVVLTYLPRDNKPPSFEAGRQALNDLLRSHCAEYADGLADIAADPRIGDPKDCLDLTYYQEDGLHPNAAGDAVMAEVTAPVVNGLAWRSDTCTIRARNAEGTWTDWRPYAPALSWLLDPGDGPKTVELEYRDGEGVPVLASDSIGLDTVDPVTKAPAAAWARRGGLATLRYRVEDPAPCGPRAQTVRIVVRAPGGAVVKRIRLSGRPVNETRETSFTVPLWWARGTYAFRVFAVDAAGNAQATAGSNTLRVR